MSAALETPPAAGDAGEDDREKSQPAAVPDPIGDAVEAFRRASDEFLAGMTTGAHEGAQRLYDVTVAGRAVLAAQSHGEIIAFRAERAA
jgi:hypothetical protein